MGCDSLVDIEIRYGLKGAGVDTLWGRDFAHPSRPALSPTLPPAQWVPGLFSGKKSGRGVTLIIFSCSAEVKDKLELYIYSYSRPS